MIRGYGEYLIGYPRSGQDGDILNTYSVGRNVTFDLQEDKWDIGQPPNIPDIPRSRGYLLLSYLYMEEMGLHLLSLLSIKYYVLSLSWGVSP